MHVAQSGSHLDRARQQGTTDDDEQQEGAVRMATQSVDPRMWVSTLHVLMSSRSTEKGGGA
ncbi:hypothetical protein RSM1_10170 [Methylobacterium radiotolerans]|nr:hypothetical protein RSM1_10170 [Methylobacterium radiotolerans]